MKLSTEESISLVINKSITQYNQQFIKWVNENWDWDGQGCYANYVRQQVARCWCIMVRQN